MNIGSLRIGDKFDITLSDGSQIEALIIGTNGNVRCVANIYKLPIELEAGKYTFDDFNVLFCETAYKLLKEYFGDSLMSTSINKSGVFHLKFDD